MDNANRSPAFEWTGVPEGTQSFALTLKDVSYGQPLWAIWNIPGDETGLPADLPKDTTLLDMPAGAEQSNSTFATGEGYFGPESPCNVYQFDLYALSMPTYEPRDKEYAAEVETQLSQLSEGVLGHATLTGRTKYNSTCQ
jgi:ribose transport system ATP-binding protein